MLLEGFRKLHQGFDPGDMGEGAPVAQERLRGPGIPLFKEALDRSFIW